MNSPTGPRIELEPLVGAHAAELFPVLSEVAIYEYLDDQPPTSLATLEERYRRLESRCSADGSQRWLNWAIRRSKDGQCVGYVQATIHPDATANVAYVLGPPFWGLGLAHEASTLMLASLFAEFGVTSAFATVDRRNHRSSALLDRLGFRRIPAAAYPHGSVSDSDDAFRLDRPSA